MSTTTAELRRSAAAPRTIPAHQLALRVLGAALALGVVYIHVKDQGGLPGHKSPTYVGIGYYLLELASLGVAIALLVRAGRHTVGAWLLALGVAVGPIVGYVLSRGPGLPSYTEDRGNWSEPIGVAGLLVEGLLLLLAAAVLLRSRRRAG